MTDSVDDNPPLRKVKRRRRWPRVLAVLVLVGVPLALIYYFTRPAQLIPQIENAIAQAVGGEVTIGNARVTRQGKITLEQVEVRVPGVAGEFGRLFTAEQIQLWGKPRGLIDGSYSPDRVEIDQPVLYLTEAPSDGRFNFELLTPAKSDTPDDLVIPDIRVRDGEIRFARLDGTATTALSSIKVDGGLEPEQADPAWYSFVFNEKPDAQGTPGVNLTGRFNPDRPALELKLSDFRYVDEYRFFLPPEARQWSERLAPTGRVERMTISLGANDRGQLSVGKAEVIFADVGLNLDVFDTADPDQYEIALLLRAIRTRLTDITGRLSVTNDRFTLRGTGMARQTGLGVSPIQYRVEATGDLDVDQGVAVQIETDPFVIEDRYEYLLALMPLTGDAYRRFKPSGELSLAARFEIPSDGAEPTWGLVVDLIDAQITHRMFPMTLQHLAGRIEVTPERATLDGLTATTASDAKVTLNGVITPPSDIAEVKLDIDIRDMPIDSTLVDAMQPGERENIERFFDPEKYQALIDQGLIAPTDDGSAPKFVMGGMVDVFVPVYRPYGEEGTYSIVPRLDLTGVNVLMRDFPYPATVDRGTVDLGPDYVVINDLALTGITGGGIKIDGRADKDDASGDYLPKIKLSETLLPIDPLLLNAIGGDAEELLTDLGITAVARVQGELFQTPEDDDVDMALDIVVTDGRAQPYGGSVVFEDVAGLLHLKGNSIPRMNFSGTRGDATLGIVGSVQWNTDGDTSAELEFDADDVALERALLEVLPPDSELRAELSALFDEYEPEGVVDAELLWKPTSDDEPDEFVAQVRPASLAFNYGEGRLRFDQVAGSVTVWPEYMQLNELTGDFVDPPLHSGTADRADAEPVTGKITASGEISFDDEPRIALAFSGNSSEGLGQTVRLLMPEPVVELVESLEYSGPIQVRNADLLIKNTGGAEQETTFLAEFHFDDSSLVVGGLALTEVTGQLGVDILDSPPPTGSNVAPPPRMRYTLDIDRMRAKDRLITRVRGEANNEANRQVLRTNRIVGSMYNGTAVIEAAADLVDETEPGGVRMVATLHDVELGPVLKPIVDAPDQAAQLAADNNPPGPADRNKTTGLLSASLQLDTGYGEDAKRIGRGTIRIRDAGLLTENPLELWSLQALNLNMPDRRGFDQASAEFQLIDDTILLEQFSMQTRGKRVRVAGITLFEQATRIVGEGTVSYPDLQLDLRMRSQMIGTAERLPLAGPLRSLRGELAGFRVTGTLEDPDVNMMVLPELRD